MTRVLQLSLFLLFSCSFVYGSSDYKISPKEQKLIDSLEHKRSEVVKDPKLRHERLGKIKLYEECYNRCIKKGWLSAAIVAKMNAAELYFAPGEFRGAHKAFLEALKISEDIGETRYRPYLLGDLGMLYSSLEKWDKSFEYLQQSYQIFKSTDRIHESAYALLELGDNKYLNDQLDDAEKLFNRAEQIFSEMEHETFRKYGLGYTNIGLGKVLAKRRGKESIAKNHFIKAIELLTPLRDPYGLSLANSELGGLYLSINEIADAEKVLLVALDIIDKSDFKKLEGDCTERLAEVYNLQHNYKSAYENKARSIRVKDSLNGITVRGQISEANIRYESEKKERKIAENQLKIDRLAHKQKSYEQRVMYIMILSVVVLCAMIYGIVRQYRSYKRKIQLKSVQEELYINKIKTRELEQKALESELTHKNRELTTYALDICRKRAFLNSIRDRINDLVKKEENEIKLSFEEIVKEFRGQLSIEEDLRDFYDKASALEDNFHQNLSSLGFGLTKNDLHLCALVRLELSTKEIAEIKNVAPKTIRMGKYRLKRKLNLGENDDLAIFLKDVASNKNIVD